MNILNKVAVKSMKLNKVSTIVTIIGIVISLTMFTAVITSVTSTQKFMVNSVIYDVGSWYAHSGYVDREDLEKLMKEEEIDKLVSSTMIGRFETEDAPYVINGISDGFTDLVSLRVSEGRLPENEGEIVVPLSYKKDNGKEYKIGDNIRLSYICEADKSEVIKNYKVVGIDSNYYELNFYGDECMLTYSDGSDGAKFDAFYTIDKMKNIENFVNSRDYICDNTNFNKYLLMYSGAGLNKGINKFLYSFAGILAALIMVGSVSLIYNSFAISMSERTRQYGIFKSIGATKKQISKSVIHEGMLLSIIGIPLGIVLGIVGMKITFSALGDYFSMLFSNVAGVNFEMYINVPGIAIAALIGALTVFISVRIPSKKVNRISAVDAIRQSGEIKNKEGKYKTSKLTYKLFKFEGVLARKNFMRNKRKSRATIISLFLSIVLFIAASCLCDYLAKGIEITGNGYNYDILYLVEKNDIEQMPLEEIDEIVRNTAGVTKVVCSKQAYGSSALCTEDMLDKSYVEFIKSVRENYTGKMSVNIRQYFVDDDYYEEILKDNKLSKSDLIGEDYIKGIVFNKATVYDKKYIETELLNRKLTEIEVSDSDLEQGGVKKRKIEIGAMIEKAPVGVSARNSEGDIQIIFPLSKINKVLPDATQINNNYSYMINSNNISGSLDYLTEQLVSREMDCSNIYDMDDVNRQSRALISIVKVFSYGFIILISMIAIANVFNTISTNVVLRRREFAMLRSVGMTQKGFKRMMNYECVLYGLKGVAYGVPVSVLVDYLIWKALARGIRMEFLLPVKNVIIAVVSVFVIVFATMLYAMDKVKKDDMIDSLKNENI
ncbi:MAG: FtsX-like permease family protein [Butyrivibrio sp.]|nr:FtsX-like permease family protein [Butyrivibrio sp.]